MNRRIALRHLALISGGLAFIPSCDFSSDDILAAYEKLKVTESQKKLLGDISNTIIPAGEIKGALDLEVNDFILVMVNDCMDEETQQRFTKGFSDFPAYAKAKAGSKFENLESKEKESLILTGLQAEEEENQSVKFFLSSTKSLTIQGFMASEYIQSEVIPYSLIPGEYKGEVLISDIQNTNTNG